MKRIKLFMLIGLLFLTTIGICQSDKDALSKTYHSELGLDVTSLMGRTSIIGAFGFYSIQYQPTYYFYYRYRFNNFRLRAAAGGNATINNLENSNHEEWSYDYKLGLELFTKLGKRWELYYGVDALQGKTKRYYEYERYAEYLISYDQETSYSGAAPFVGLRFEITKRMNITVEMSTYLRREHVIDNRLFIKDVVDNPTRERPEDSMDDYNQMRIQYIAPDFFVLNFLL